MRFATKIALVVRDDLATWQKLNVTAFLASGVAGGVPGTMGLHYEDGDGTRYLPMLRQPVLVYSGDGPALARCRRRALERGLAVAVYTHDMFATGNDDDNRAAVRAVAAERLDLVGLAVYGERAVVDRVVDKVRLHP